MEAVSDADVEQVGDEQAEGVHQFDAECEVECEAECEA